MHSENLKSTLEKLNCKEDADKETDEINKKKIEQRYTSARILIDGQIKMIHNFITCIDK